MMAVEIRLQRASIKPKRVTFLSLYVFRGPSIELREATENIF